MSVRAGFSRLFDRLKPVRTLVLLLLACAHTPPPPPVPPPLVPRAAVDMMCTRMHAEGMSGELRALKMSQPLITPPAIEALASAIPDMFIPADPDDPMVYAMVVAVLLAVTLLSSYLPARRAAGIDPNECLRCE